ncbi:MULTISPECIES: hypothetical protein [unclassified Aureimonas]|uniref:hypothetical protein n=1 Tax=unclassified Aureimonas TaxID=2615206 RepID=UPI000701403F|nr:MULTISPECIES: hypothetical protein [unclassified Aureimonas]KQT52273.1 hypothetical protein ASG62_16590 [Aureimonas sp. Leaf427]KQT73247.1 hypothetical protein ASG54_17865 [Aureimonas sp. Leaf460]
MPFQGNNFVRSQNFVRDRDLGAPDNTISADKVDDEFDGMAAALTTVKTAAETAVSTVRGGIDEPRNTLQKLADWIKATLLGGVTAGGYLRGKADASGWESRTPAEVRSDIELGALTKTATGVSVTGTLATSGGASLSSATIAGLRVGGETIGTGSPAGGQPGDKYFKV